MPATISQLEGLYLAYFGRPADADGLAYYVSHPELDIWAVARNFSASPESQALYGANFNASVIDAIYLNLFNRHAEAGGIEYWSGEVTSGRLSAAGAAFAILLGAQNEDKTTVDNKLAACEAFTSAMDTPAEKASYSGDAAAAYARDVIASVDDTPTSLASSLALASMHVTLMPLATAQPAGANTLTLDTPMSSTNSATLDSVKTSFVADQGFMLDAAATLGGVLSGARLEFDGAASRGTLTTQLGSDTASDTVMLKLNPDYSENYDGTHTFARNGIFLHSPGVEQLGIVSTAHNETPSTQGVAGDGATNFVFLGDTGLQRLIVSGDQPIHITGDSGLSNLQFVDASSLEAATPPPTDVDSNDAYGFSFAASYNALLQYMIGAKHSTNALFGSDAANTIVGGELDDQIYGGHGNDTLTGGGGHDRFGYDIDATSHTTDEITDFVANTIGTTAAATSQAARDGDVIDLSWYAGVQTIWVDVADNGSMAQVHLFAAEQAGGFDAYAALDSSTGMLYIELPKIGGELQIQLDGVSTIGTAAFLLDNNLA